MTTTSRARHQNLTHGVIGLEYRINIAGEGCDNTVMRLIFLSLCLSLPMATVAQTCPSNLAKTLRHLDAWDEYVYDTLDYRPISAFQELQVAVADLSARLAPLQATNEIIYRYNTFIDDFEVPLRELRLASNSLSGIANCLARVPVNVRSFNEASVPGMIALKHFIRPPIFRAVDGVYVELAATGKGSAADYHALIDNLRAINRHADLGGGSFVACENLLKMVQSRPISFSVDPYYIEGEEPYQVLLSPALASLTVGEAKDFCGL